MLMLRASMYHTALFRNISVAFRVFVTHAKPGWTTRSKDQLRPKVKSTLSTSSGKSMNGLRLPWTSKIVSLRCFS